jgi:hypothetical protein
VEKAQFVTLLRNYTSLSREEADALIAVQPQFPYSQVLHNLCSRAAQDFHLDSRDRYLHTSAVYSTERSVLKYIMTSAKKERHEDVPLVKTRPPAEVVKPKVEAPKVVAPTADNPLWTMLADDMKKLEASKNRFEAAMAKLDKSWEMPVAPKPPRREPTVLSEPVDALIEEIKSKKKVKPEGTRQKEQIEIIENFIKTQPTISRIKQPEVKPVDPQDLAEESGVESDHIVSETLVEILLKQGRKDKAIEVLKKLIWKIPQKKAYFAAQIEELKK